MVVPAERAVTEPVPEPMLATAGVLLVQVPPVVVSVSVVSVPVHVVNVPPIAAGKGLTVMVVFLEQPVDAWVKVIIAVAADTPDTVPVAGSTVATAVLEDAQVPATFVKIVEPPTHTVGVPPEAAGGALTVITAVVVAVPQPLEIV